MNFFYKDDIQLQIQVAPQGHAIVSYGLFHVNTWDVHRSMSWIFFFLSVVVDNDEIWKSWNFERRSPYRFHAGAIENLGGRRRKRSAVRMMMLRGP